MTCTTSEDPYAIAEGMTREQGELLRQMVNLAKEKATLIADTNKWGPQRTKAYVEHEMKEARDVAHDRFLLEEIAAGRVDPLHAHSHAKKKEKVGG